MHQVDIHVWFSSMVCSLKCINLIYVCDFPRWYVHWSVSSWPACMISLDGMESVIGIWRLVVKKRGKWWKCYRYMQAGGKKKANVMKGVIGACRSVMNNRRKWWEVLSVYAGRWWERSKSDEKCYRYMQVDDEKHAKVVESRLSVHAGWWWKKNPRMMKSAVGICRLMTMFWILSP